MRIATALATLIVIALAAGLYLAGHAGQPEHNGSPAFEALLGQAVNQLEDVSRQVTATAVPEVRAEAQTPTVDEYTCTGFRTCSGFATCDGSGPTCDGEITCGYSTCSGALTCWNTCYQFTVGADETCTGSATCTEGCPGWPTYHDIIETCAGGPTCELTCFGFVSCSGCPVGSERTTWGEVKAEFAD